MNISLGSLIGLCIGAAVGLLLITTAVVYFCLHRRSSHIRSNSSRRPSTIPIRANGFDASSVLSDSTNGLDSPMASQDEGTRYKTNKRNTKSIISMSGVPKYSFKDLQKATNSFTTVIGQGASAIVYKAHLATGETVAVKALTTKSREGEKEFLSEVLLLGRLHHKNLVNLVGYCYDKGQNMLIYVFMPNGSLASHLYSGNFEPLSWDLRISIALDVARGIEYLHDGAIPPVLHRDIKSNNILLDRSMAARVADFGLSREETVHPHASSIRGTFGYLDPQYVSTRTYTQKSDVYSFGVLLFELITGRNPQQGLMEYIELAAISAGGKSGWEEIADTNLDGNFDVKELNRLAALAYKCIYRRAKRRPSMRDIVQELCRIQKSTQSRNTHHRQTSSVNTLEEDLTESEHAALSDHHGEDSTGSFSDLPDV